MRPFMLSVNTGRRKTLNGKVCCSTVADRLTGLVVKASSSNLFRQFYVLPH